VDSRILDYYNRELQHIREMGAEFAHEYPKIAGRLGLEGFECADPYVERLLEGFAFLAARVRLKVDAEFPAFTQHLLEIVYPHFLAPTPSMAVVELQPDLTEGSLAEGFSVPRDSILRGLLGKGQETACEYRTAHDVNLWPLELKSADYIPSRGAVATMGVPNLPNVHAAIRLTFACTAGLNFSELSLERLPLFLRGADAVPMRIYEQMLGNSVAMIVKPRGQNARLDQVVDKSHIKRVGFSDDQALLPYGPRSFQGYRLLQEYFAFPERYSFVEIGNLGPAVQGCEGSELDVLVLLNRSDPELEGTLNEANFGLFCTPAVNLFPRRADRIHINERESEFHILPDRTRPMDFEVHSVSQVVGYGSGGEKQQEFQPFYGFNDWTRNSEGVAYYTLNRQPRLASSRQQKYGARSSYVGSEAFISLVDASEAPYSSDLNQLAVNVLCTNRDLPLQLPVGQGSTDFTIESAAPVEAVKVVAGPTRPRPSNAEGKTAWQLVSHLSLNYLTLVDNDEVHGAAALRELLALYSETRDPAIRKQVGGIQSVKSQPVTRRIPRPGPITFGRGLQIKIVFEESAFEGSGIFLLGAVLEQFFARYVSINSFTETIIASTERGEVMRWPVRIGQRQTL
jgi:type VI secretion system protein ImpG